MNLSAKDETERIDLLEGRELSVVVALENGYSWYTDVSGFGHILEEKKRPRYDDVYKLHGKTPPKYLDQALWDYDLPDYSGTISHALTLLSQVEDAESFKFFSLEIIAKTGKVTAKFDFTSADGNEDPCGGLEEQICTAICRAFLKWKRRNE